MENTFSDYWNSPELKELRHSYSAGLDEINQRADLNADEKSVLIDLYADEFTKEHDIGEFRDDEGNPNTFRVWMGYMLRSAKRSARIDDLMAQHAIEALNTGHGIGMSAEEAIAMLENDGVMDAMAEKYGSNSAVKMQ